MITEMGQCGPTEKSENSGYIHAVLTKHGTVGEFRTITSMETNVSNVEAKKRIGPSIDPCGTPDVTGTSLERSPSRTTVCDLPFRKALI